MSTRKVLARQTLNNLLSIRQYLRQTEARPARTYFPSIYGTVQGGTCDDERLEDNHDDGICGLYMAESTIPNAGWGVFAGHDVKQGVRFDEDATILVTDLVDPLPMPTSLPEYFWTSDVTESESEASSVKSLLPGIGALSNAHPANLNNVVSGGIGGRRRIGYGNASTGAFSHLTGHAFIAALDLSEGQELLTSYGDESGFALYHRDPPGESDNREIVDNPHNRSIAWLKQHGACLDRLQVQPSRAAPYQSGAYLKPNRRPVQRGQTLATLPMIAMTRDNMRLHNNPNHQQLMVNYCFGHPESSLLLFPYSPVVNLVNHGVNGTANVEIRWSRMNNDTMRKLAVAQLLDTTTSARGIVMEFFALKDVLPGDEVLLDYGRHWDTAWQRHEHEWQQPPRHHEPIPIPPAETELLAGVPRDKLYQSPQHIRDAFRHSIHIPDDIFPAAWRDLSSPTCTLYMAKSSRARGSRRLGVYTAVPIKAGTELPTSDLVVPVEDYHENLRSATLGSREPHPSWLLSWHALSGDWALAQSEADDVISILPGIEMSARPDSDFNVSPQAPKQDSALHRSVDAGAGASTPYHGSRMIAVQHISEGQELFVQPNPDDSDAVSQGGSTATRSVEWLVQNGQCVDNLHADDSTILQAGKGAFASRVIAKNAVIAPVPVVPFQRHNVDIVEHVSSEFSDTEGADGASLRHLGEQLLLNYCYGHTNSSLLFFPKSPVVNYINHNHKANAKLQWSTLWPPSRTILSSSPERVSDDAEASLVMELIALREIRPGEEVFLDYGEAWSDQWRRHESVSRPDSEYVPAFRLNRRQEWLRTEEELKTDPYPENVWVGCFVGRIRKIEMMMAGVYESLVEYWWEEEDGMYEDTENLLPCSIVERISEKIVGQLRPTGTDPVPKSDPADFVEARDRRESVSPLPMYYKVRVHDGPASSQQTNFYPVPREAIRFFDKPYTSDLSLRTAFRHEIQLPDSMVPPAWLDLARRDVIQQGDAATITGSDEL